ncbi:hypothetical protein [Streptomyces fructofermentans]|uniref:Uncharacterized protein n=1 Tax=Streptomyces fructofermentans TaxID=152141 RepID=A0A918U5I2_9ACTN|nr:hypothetical protein [Streptomyces fructofermentans]GGX94971.1 hypothetical protein GCM10010515_72120 [Streptomyces fructofermentans]
MVTSSRAQPAQVSTLNGIGALLMKGVAALVVPCGPTVLAVAVLLPDPHRIVLLVGTLTTAVSVPGGVALWRLAGRNRAGTRRLEAVGVRATAEVLTSTLTASDEGHTYEVVMRVSGFGFEPFEVTQSRTGSAGLSAGARLQALVNPHDCSYAILD